MFRDGFVDSVLVRFFDGDLFQTFSLLATVIAGLLLILGGLVFFAGKTICFCSLEKNTAERTAMGRSISLWVAAIVVRQLAKAFAFPIIGLLESWMVAIGFHEFLNFLTHLSVMCGRDRPAAVTGWLGMTD